MTIVNTKPIIEARTLLDAANRNYGIIQRQVAGLSHEDSLLQLPFRGNCLNWVVGHITQSRNKMLKIVGEPTVWTDEQIARYDRESQPVVNGNDAIPFEQILADWKLTHERFIEKLGSMTQDDLLLPAPEVIKGIPDWSISEFLNFLLWHETYHVGQTEILRQLAGTNDKVI
jgi:uncharacterized damage-inducible protein DinB